MKPAELSKDAVHGEEKYISPCPRVTAMRDGNYSKEGDCARQRGKSWPDSMHFICNMIHRTVSKCSIILTMKSSFGALGLSLRTEVCSTNWRLSAAEEDATFSWTKPLYPKPLYPTHSSLYKDIIQGLVGWLITAIAVLHFKCWILNKATPLKKLWRADVANLTMVLFT